MSNLSAFALAPVYDLLTDFANRDNFWGFFETAFGTQYDRSVAEGFRSQWLAGDFGQSPSVEVVSQLVLGAANGAYAASTNRVYLSDRFVATAGRVSLIAVLLEEFGHFVDAQVNQVDTQGDEGEKFSALLQGYSLTSQELERINTENDWATITVDGNTIAVEQAAPIILTVNTTADQNDGSAANGLSLRDAILIANANPDTEYEIHLTGGVTYTLSSNGINEDNAKTGDLDIKSRNNVLFIGAFDGQKATINASGLLNSDRVFDILSGGVLGLVNVVVTGGAVGFQGGGIYVGSNGILGLFNATITNNKSLGFEGGGIFNYKGTVYLTDGSVISNNQSDKSGGGIANAGGTLTAINSTIDNNRASYGGGINNYLTGSVTLINTTISNNKASSSTGFGGGISSSSYASLGIFNTTISGNSVGDSGGGIRNEGSANIVNSTITNNTAAGGANQGGGGIYSIGDGVSLKNTIVAGNFGKISTGLGKDIYGTVNGNSYNLIGDLAGASGTVGTGTDKTFTSAGITNINQVLDPILKNNGGLTSTHALVLGSPAINGGNNSLLPADTEDLNDNLDNTEQIPFDQRGTGFNRIVGGTVDIGAFEVQAPPTLSIDNVTLAEGNSGTANATFTVTRAGTATNSITVSYTTTDGTATAGSDYTATNGTLTFLTNEITKTITVPIFGDTVIEPDETFFVNLSNATNANIAKAQGIGTILNDDFPIISLAVSPANVTEDGIPNLVYTFSRTGAATNALTVNYSITGTADSTDYTGATPGTGKTITFAAGSNTATLTIDPTADTTVEPDETVALTLATGTGYTVGTTTAVTGSILNDDFPTISLAVSPASVTEDDTPNLVYTFSRTGAATNALTVNYSIAGTADSTDYTGATPGTAKTITFAAGSNTATLTIDPTADTTVEPDETVALTLATGTGYTVGTTTAVTGTILNDDYLNIESSGNTKLVKDATNQYYAQIGNKTAIAIKKGGQQIFQNIYTADWQILAAETVNGQNQVLWKNISGNILQVWKLDSNWNFVSADGNWALNSPQSFTQETNFQIDANGDGIIGSPFTTIEAVGNTSLVKDASNKYFAQTGNNTAIAIKNGGQQIYQNIYGSDWQTLAVETINGENQVLWKNVAGNFLHIWHLDSNWNWKYSEGQWALNSPQAQAKETLFQVDANSDGVIGAPIEANGNTILVKDIGDFYFAKTGNNPSLPIKINGQQIYAGIYPNWQTLAAENINGENQVLWKNVAGNFLHIWHLDSNWNWVSSEGSWGLNSTDALNQEIKFAIDANGDGIIGNPASLNLIGTSGNDTLIGGANTDTLTGGGGKDILTGGGGSDRFDYKTLTDSLLANYDVITDFNANPGNDLFLVTTARSGFTNAGAVNTLDAAGITTQLTPANFAANAAAQFTFTSGTTTRTFIAINDANAGFSSTTDALIEITGLAGTLSIANFVTV